MNTVIDFLVYTGLTRVFLFWDEHKVLAACLAFIIANINSYVLNKYWTFTNKEKDHRIQYTKFLAVSLVGLGLNLLIFYSLIEFGLYDLIAKIAPIPIILLWNFVINKIWTFKKKFV